MEVLPGHKCAIADLVRPGELTRSWTITRINVPEKERGQRYGSLLLWRICKEADAELRSLQLEPDPSGPLDRDQLIAWYGRYGFRMTDAGYMKRMPLAFPLPPNPLSAAKIGT